MSKVVPVNPLVNNYPYDKGKNAFNRGEKGRRKLGVELGFQVYFEPTNVTFQIHRALSALVILY